MSKQNQTTMKVERNSAPARTLEGREQQLAALATEVSEMRMRNGTATSAELLYHMHNGSSEAKLKRQVMELEKDLLIEKTNNLKANKRMDEMYTQALSAMRSYQGIQEDFNYEEFED